MWTLSSRTGLKLRKHSAGPFLHPEVGWCLLERPSVLARILRNPMPRLMKFSERKGLKPVKNVIQVEMMDEDLRTSIWNFFDTEIFSQPVFLYDEVGRPGDIQRFSRAFWSDYLREPADTRPTYPDGILKEIRSCYFAAKWFEVYDFVEFLISF